TDHGWVTGDDDDGSPAFMLHTYFTDGSHSWQPWSSFVGSNGVNETLLRYMDNTRYRDRFTHDVGPSPTPKDMRKLASEQALDLTPSSATPPQPRNRPKRKRTPKEEETQSNAEE